MLFSYFSQMVQVHFVTEQQHPVTVPVFPLNFLQNTPGHEQRRPVRDREHHQKDLTRHEINHSSVRVENLQRYPVVSDVNCFVVQCGFNKIFVSVRVRSSSRSIYSPWWWYSPMNLRVRNLTTSADLPEPGPPATVTRSLMSRGLGSALITWITWWSSSWWSPPIFGIIT